MATKMETEDTPSFPMRINKYLAWKKISTRKGADALISDKKVFINGKLAVLGSKVNDGDKVEVKGAKAESYQYFAYYKPIGVETDSPRPGLFPIGRLDKASHGLLILTNDGRITDKLLNPKYVHEKEYIVRTKNKLRSSFKGKMEAGVNIEGYVTQRCQVKILSDFTFKIILTEGKKHQIRRMCSALFQEVEDLKRERIMNIKLGTLKPKGLREIKGKELADFLAPILR
jgi:23S rRNA pseudouridine2604 synthase